MNSTDNDRHDLKQPLLSSYEALGSAPRPKKPSSNSISRDASDDSEYEEPEVKAPTKPTSSNQKSSKGCCSTLKENIKSVYDRVTFVNSNRFFGDDYQKVCHHLPALSADMQPSYQIRLFEDIWRDTTQEKLASSTTDTTDLLDTMARDPQRSINLWQIISKAIRRDFFWAVLFRILSHIVTILLPYVMKQYLLDIKSFKKVALLDSVFWCMLAALGTLWAEIWTQLSSRWASPARGRAIEMLRDNFFIKLLDSDIYFLSQADGSFLSKLMLYESIPFEGFVDALISMVSAPIPIIFAVVLIYLEFKTNDYIFVLMWFLGILSVLIFIMHTKSVSLKKQFRSFGSKCTGEVEELTSEAQFVKANFLQKRLLRQVWKFRSQQIKLQKTIHMLDACLNFMFSAPVIAGSLLLLAIQNSDNSNEFDAVTIFAVLAAVGSLRLILSNLSEALSAYQDFRPSYEVFSAFFNCVARTPKIAVFELSKSGDLENQPKIRVQFPQKMPKSEILSRIDLLPDAKSDFGAIFDGCTFKNYSSKTKEYLDTVFNEQLLKEKQKVLEGDALATQTLADLTLTIRRGAKVCVMGEEASGQQTFLDALSNEHHLFAGLLLVRGQVVHFDARRFHLLKVSIIENIVLDRKVNRQKLSKICAAIGLRLDEFVGGERGTLEDNPNLTELQKSNILLARALYSKSDMFLFSNFFDNLALDEKVDVFDRIVKQHLSLTTVVFHSNDRLLADRADFVLVFDGGRIVEQGTPASLAANPYSMFCKLGNAQKLIQGSFILMKSKLETRRLRRRPGITGLDGHVQQTVIQIQRKQQVSRFMKIVGTILLFKRTIRSKKLQSHQAFNGQPQEVMLTKSLTESILKFLKIRNPRTPYYIALLALISGALFFIFDTFLGWWSTSRKSLSEQGNRQVFWVLIGIAVVSGWFNLLRDVIYTSIMRGVSSRLFFSSVKRILRSDMQWFKKLTAPLIIYNITHYQMIMDDEFSARIMRLANNIFLILFALLIANFCFPGYFFIVTLCVLCFMRACISRVIRSLEITIPKNFAGRVDWFGCYIENLRHTLSMRYVNRSRYLMPGFEKAVWKCEAHRSIQSSTSGRYLGFRSAVISAILIFIIYISPVITYHTKLTDYSTKMWVLSIELLWAGRLSQYLSSFMNSIAGLTVAVEGGERLWLLQTDENDFLKIDTEPKSSKPDAVDGLESQRTTFYLQPAISDDYKMVLEMENVSFKDSRKILLNGVNLTVQREDKIALIQHRGKSVNTLFDLVLGFSSVPKSQREQCAGWKFKLFEKNIENMELNLLKDRVAYLTADPPLFSGTWRDNIDPNRSFKDYDIIAVLAALGFDDAFSNMGDIFRSLSTYRGSAVASVKTALAFSRLGTVLKRNSHVAALLDDADAQKNQARINSKYKKVLFKFRLILLVLKWRKEAMANQAKLREDKLLESDMSVLGVTHPRSLSYLRSLRNIFTSKIDMASVLPKVASKSKARIERMLDMEVDRREVTTYLKRIVALARVLLTQPDLLIAEEDSFITSTNPDKVARVLDVSFAVLRKSTMLCKISSYNLIYRFTRCTIFDEARITSQGTSEDIMRDMAVEDNATQTSHS